MKNRNTTLTARYLALAGFLTIALGLASCSSKKSTPPPSPPPPPVTVSSVAVAAQPGDFATATEAANGTVVQFIARASMSNSTSNDVTSTATWASSDATILAFETATLPHVATAKKAGAVTVTATESGGTPGTLSYTVIAAVPKSLAISPAQVPNTIPIGQHGYFTATYTLTDNSTADATKDVDWSSNNGGVAMVGNNVDNKGRVVALSAGTTFIRAFKGVLTPESVLVSVSAPAAAPEFVLNPTSPDQLPLARTQQFLALLKYADGKVVDVTETVVWQSSDESVAQFPAGFPKGLLLASPTSTGAVNITAQDPSSTVQTAPVTINVSNVAINEVLITPEQTADKPLPTGANRQLGVLALYADSVVRDITQTVNWTTAASYMTVTNNTGSKGLVRANVPRPPAEAVGTIVITDPVSMQSVNVAIDTTGRTLARIEIAPADNKMLPKGYIQRFQASAIYSDGSADPATDQVTWVSSAGDTVAISNIPADKGMATAKTEGSAVIHAVVNIDSKTYPSNSVVIEVTAAVLESIAIQPTAAVDLSVGGTQRLSATGTFSDTSTRDVTSLVNWRSDNTAVASVETSGSARGTVTGVAVGGPATITAYEPRLGVLATKQVSVSAKMEDTLAVFPAGVTAMPVGLPVTYGVILTFSDTTTLNVSKRATWTSSNPAIATISNEGGREGTIIGKTVGDVTVTASAGGLTSAAVTFRVLAGTLSTIAITPPAQVAVNVGDTVNFTAQGTYSDASTQDLTKTVVWNSDELGKAVISSTAPDQGKLVAKGSGLATITASKEAVTSLPGTSVVVASQTTITTVLEITNGCCANRTVTMRGTAITWSGGEDYTFRDSSGPTIDLEWESGPPIPLNQEVLVTGVPEVSGSEVDVSTWTFP